MCEERRYERAAWIWFALVAAVGLVMGLLVWVDPSSGVEVWARFGHEAPPVVSIDAAAAGYVAFISHWAATGTVGFDLFGVLIAATAFRRGERWAWLAMGYWPVLFATHFAMYTSSFRYAQLGWLALSVGALAATYRRTWRTVPGSHEGDHQPRSGPRTLGTEPSTIPNRSR